MKLINKIIAVLLLISVFVVTGLIKIGIIVLVIWALYKLGIAVYDAVSEKE